MFYQKMDERLGETAKEPTINDNVTAKELMVDNTGLLGFVKNTTISMGVQTLSWFLTQIEDLAESGIYESDEDVFGGCLNTDLSKLDLSLHDDEYAEETGSSLRFK